MSLFIETVGRDRTQPSIAMLHGWGLNGAIWDGVRDALAAHFTLQIVDLPGHGFSRDVSLTTVDAVADSLSAALVGPCHVMGWSIGGQFALALARRHPALVQKLILVATTPKFVASDDWPDGSHGTKADVLNNFSESLSNNYAATIRGFLALQALHQPDARIAVSALQRAMSLRGEPIAASLQAGLEILRRSDLRGDVPDILHPTLVIQGDHDALTREGAARWLAETMPNAQYALIPHAAHAPFLSHRKIFLNHVLNHLQSPTT